MGELEFTHVGTDERRAPKLRRGSGAWVHIKVNRAVNRVRTSRSMFQHECDGA